MGSTLTVAPSALDDDWAGATFTVPELPWDLDFVLSAAALRAMTDASRAIGRLEGASRAAANSCHPGLVLSSIEAWSSATLAGAANRWAHVGRAFASDSILQAGIADPGEVAAELLRFYCGLSRLRDWGGLLQPVHGGMTDEAVVTPRFRRELSDGLEDWILEGPPPPLLRVALALLSVAAANPSSPACGVAARFTFTITLRHALGVQTHLMVPISRGFFGHEAEWPVIAAALSSGHGYDTATVNDALEKVFRAVERAAVAGAYEVEAAGYRVRRAVPPKESAWLQGSRRTVSNVFGAVHALPAVALDKLVCMLRYTRRSVDRALRELAEHGLVRVDGPVRGDADYVVASRPRWKPWILR